MYQRQWVLDTDFPERLASFRKKRLTQKELSELIGVHVVQIRRYESGSSQPTLDVIRKIAVVLQVSADKLIFDDNERGPDGDLCLHFEAVSELTSDEKRTVKNCLKG